MIEDIFELKHYPNLERCCNMGKFYLVDVQFRELFSPSDKYPKYKGDITKIVVKKEEYWRIWEEYYDSVTNF